MKAAPFSYVRPTTPRQVVAELDAARRGEDVKVIAGGQSLIPVLAMRLGRPATLIDITRVAAWQQIEVGTHVRIGAAVRQRTAERATGLGIPLLARALPWIGHREIRSRGTICGSLSHADPASELPAVALTLGARFSLLGSGGTRMVEAADFFRGAMTTALRPGEVLRHVEFPRARPGQGFGFAEHARRHGDFALVGVTALVELAEDARIGRAILGAFGVADRPKVLDVTELVGELLLDDAASDRAPAVAEALTEPTRDLVSTGGDRHASRAFRRRLVRVLGSRELITATRAARNGKLR